MINIGFTPKAVFINNIGTLLNFSVLSAGGAMKLQGSSSVFVYTTATKIVANGFQVSTDGSNNTGANLEYTAIG